LDFLQCSEFVGREGAELGVDELGE
jgi:hypothetical protein